MSAVFAVVPVVAEHEEVTRGDGLGTPGPPAFREQSRQERVPARGGHTCLRVEFGRQVFRLHWRETADLTSNPNPFAAMTSRT